MNSLSIFFPEKQQADITVKEIPPLRENQILCKTQYSLISTGTELHLYNGVFDQGTDTWENMIKYPLYPGYSNAAEVVETGAAVSDFKPGDRILSRATHQQYHILDSDCTTMVKIHDAVPGDQATFGVLGRTTQLGVRRADVKLGESAAVIGLGILGQLSLQYLHVLGVRQLVGVDLSPSRLEPATKSGAMVTLNSGVDAIAEDIESITEGRMLDIVMDVTGRPEVLGHCVPLVRKLGRVVLLGDTPTPSQQTVGPCVVSHSVSILGIHGSMFPPVSSPYNPWTFIEMVKLFFDYLIDGRMRVDHLISHRVAPEEAPGIYADLYNDRTDYMGVIIDWGR